MPGFEHAYLIREASALGVRESYRIVGKYVLSEDDYIKRARFEDAIGKGDWYIDVHSATKGLVHMEKYQRGEYYEIPYRCLINEQVDNLLCRQMYFYNISGSGEYPYPADGDRYGRCGRKGMCGCTYKADCTE